MTVVAALENAAHEVKRAVVVPGPVPQHHRSIMSRHRAEWPTLWEAIDHLLGALEDPAQDEPERRPSAGANITHEFVSAGDEAGGCVWCGRDRRHAVHVGTFGHG